MPRDVSWAEQANLALNAVQAIKLTQIHDSLDTVRTVVLEEKARQAHEALLREVLFQNERALDTVLLCQEHSPLVVYTGARVAQWSLLKTGITPSCFTEFVDKDRLHVVQSKTNNLLDRAKTSLTAEQIALAEEAALFITQKKELDELIHIARQHESVDAAETGMTEAQDRLNNHTKTKPYGGILSPFLVVVAIVLLIPCSVCLFGCIALPFLSATDMIPSFFLGAVAALVPAVILFKLSSHLRPGNYKVWAEENAKLYKKWVSLRQIDAPKSLYNPARLNELRIKFGIKSVEGYVEEKSYREDAIKRVFSQPVETRPTGSILT